MLGPRLLQKPLLLLQMGPPWFMHVHVLCLEIPFSVNAADWLKAFLPSGHEATMFPLCQPSRQALATAEFAQPVGGFWVFQESRVWSLDSGSRTGPDEVERAVGPHVPWAATDMLSSPATMPNPGALSMAGCPRRALGRPLASGKARGLTEAARGSGGTADLGPGGSRVEIVFHSQCGLKSRVLGLGFLI